MPKVYLLKMIDDNSPIYKIGYTKSTVNSRLKNLQTGCPNKIIIVDEYQSDYSKIIEKTLHNIYRHKKVNGEWFKLDIYDEVNFINNCKKYETINIYLNENNIKK
ncbi:GIY-YIG nuclease family protein [Trichloromonas sp.]|jgi:hypothetical protein|uniref:GIY-YIG nuclease family protein n=1 Tax=Trichloromonas sp. TaxID=3069249 RepID=UPI002A3CCA9C|nr:GIY-YIG nuclease family protein [Trichloromonas sp.]